MEEKQETLNLSEELVFEELEERVVPSVGCATSSSCDCSSTSCIVTG
ncbi:MAG: hypothetical protein ACLQKA_23690 [Bryobacteraceae bacterium]